MEVNLTKLIEAAPYLKSLGKHWCCFGGSQLFQPGTFVTNTYRCNVCYESYATYNEAWNCSQSSDKSNGLVVGDIVLIPGCRSYRNIGVTTAWDNEKDNPFFAFIQPADLESESHFDHTATYHYYWVVASLHPQQDKPHRLLATVVSYYGEHLRYGWNPANGKGHHGLFKPGAPEQLWHEGTWDWETDRRCQPLDSLHPSDELKLLAAEIVAQKVWASNLLSH